MRITELYVDSLAAITFQIARSYSVSVVIVKKTTLFKYDSTVATVPFLFRDWNHLDKIKKSEKGLKKIQILSKLSPKLHVFHCS